MESTYVAAQLAVKKISLRKILGFALCLFFAQIAFAQHKGSVSGVVKATSGKGIEYASVALKQSDDKIFKGVLTDSVGRFVFKNVPNGSYKLVVSSMGYISYAAPSFQISDTKNIHEFSKLQLAEDAKQLATVQVTGQKKVIEQSMDKMTLNVENSILAEGNTALELLERAPGVKIDSDGKISLKGRTGVTVMMNGKLTYLSAAELAVLLKAPNSSSISKIEIINSPSSKYDAAGNAGIINIVMKKNQVKGLNGSVSANGGAGRNARYGGGFNLNYRSSNFNVYGNYNYAYRGETEYLDFIRRFADGQIATSRTSTQRTETNEPLNTHNFRVGIDYEIDSNNVIGVLVNGNLGKYIHDSETSNLIRNSQGTLLNDMLTQNYDKQSWESLTYNLNYLHRFAKKGRELSADVDFAPNRFSSNLNLDTYTRPNADFPNGDLARRRGTVPAKTDVYVAKIDYTDVISKQIKLETGAKSSFIESDNNLVYHQFINNAWEYDATSSNHFRYKEQIHAAYLNLMAEFGKTSIQAGLRGEYTNTNGNQMTTNTVFTRDYFQLFPNVVVNQNLNTNNQVQLSYSRRIERPNYGALNPFRMFRDPSLYYEGNPYLKPELTQNIVFNHVFKSRYTTSLNYSKTSDVITWVTGQNDATNTTFEAPKNLPSLINYGVSFTAQIDYFKWWSGTNFANVFRNEYDLANEQKKQTSFNLNTQNSFKITKGFGAELNAFYNSSSVYGIIKERAYWAVSAAFQKSVLNDKGSIKLAINDIFQTNNYRNDTRYQNIDMYSRIWIDSRRAILSFTYRFGKQFESRTRKTGSEDVQNRIK
ncbi:outer membrane beta-barrel protein [Pedobacter xixiisoli]|uniref:Carboxypeptidase regulatory-like domain-containing protein n=1 Tax=Pedobacter xixiisoli TaxID=1476464 RepID=A0A286A6Q5_9SPHI|nr:outer membrane beta-barrel protein [Pedobacter xixiisoli]SOD17594.1 Carboxypeptidase regulatory-like domain-containing protein [Pedobacter xixiisoli]